MQIDPDLYPWLTAALIAWGLLDCFCGYRVFKLTVACWGAGLGAFLGHTAAVVLGWKMAGQIGGLVAGALLGGGLAFMLYLAAVFVAGLLLGIMLGLLLFAQLNPVLALIVGGGLGLVGGFVALKLQKIVLILATALLGSFRALLAVMFFTQRTDWAYFLFRHPEQIPALIDNNPWMLPATVTLAAVGAFTQFGLKEKGAAKKTKS